jgi:hypothetical protein
MELRSNITPESEMVTKFKVGETYSMRSACDHNCIWTCKVVKRTAKTLWITCTGEKGILRRGISIWGDEEQVSPLGKYSMSPILGASKRA